MIEIENQYSFCMVKVAKTVDRRFKSGYRDSTVLAQNVVLLQPDVVTDVYATHLDKRKDGVYQTGIRGTVTLNVEEQERKL